MSDNERDELALIVKKVSQRFGGPRMAEFVNDPPIRKHYAIADAILREFSVTPRTEDMGPAANCHLCVGAGGHEGYDGEWIECACQRPDPQGASSYHDGGCEADWGSEGQESPCRCAEQPETHFRMGANQ